MFGLDIAETHAIEVGEIEKNKNLGVRIYCTAAYS